jgi:hypothetical protein
LVDGSTFKHSRVGARRVGKRHVLEADLSHAIFGTLPLRLAIYFWNSVNDFKNFVGSGPGFPDGRHGGLRHAHGKGADQHAEENHQDAPAGETIAFWGPTATLG